MINFVLGFFSGAFLGCLLLPIFVGRKLNPRTDIRIDVQRYSRIVRCNHDNGRNDAVG